MKPLLKPFMPLACIFMLLVAAACTSSTQDKGAETSEETEPVSTVTGEDVNYSSDTTQMRGYMAYQEPVNGKNPGVIVVHEWWGHNDYVRERADMLAGLGYTALALDMYGNGLQADHPQDAGKFSGMVMSNMELAKARFDAALELLKNHPTVDSEKIAAIGYCFGGSVVLTMANAGTDLDAVAAFHSGVQLPIMPGEMLTAKVLVCNGAEDPFISPESVIAFKQAMDSINADYQYISYPGAKHSFTSKRADELGTKFNLPLAYQKEADEQSWMELQQLLEEAFR